jgi:hypothetical protein
MKIAEVVGGYDRGTDLVNNIFTPSRWFNDTKFKQDYQRGKDIAGRITDPKQWFKGSSTKAASSEEPQMRPKESLERAGHGMKLYRNDIEILKIVYNHVRAGTITTNLNPKQLAEIIKAAYNQQPLNDQQKQTLLQFSKQF